MAEPPSSPPTDLSTPEDALAYYKAQYEQLEQELLEFQESSKELEAELEKDVEAAEKRERVLKEKAEALSFEVDEWKVSINIAGISIQRRPCLTTHRQSTSKQRPKLAQRRTLCRRKLPFYETRIEPYNSNYAT